MGSKRIVVLLMCVLAVSANSIPDQTPTEPTATIKSTTSVNADDPTTAAVLTNITDIQLSEDLIKRLENKLYDSIVEKKQDDAATQSVLLYGKGYGYVISNVVNRLIDDGIPEVFDYAVKVTAQAWYIARSHFPRRIRIHENLVFVRIIHHKYGMALKYGSQEDNDGDRTAYGTSNTESRFEITWKFVPLWYGDKVYFKVRPIDFGIFLKLGNTRDRDGDHGAYGSDNHDTDRHLWYLKPMRHDGKILFYIINREYNEPLKLSQSTDGDGDRQAYSNSNLDLNSDKYAWDLRGSG